MERMGAAIDDALQIPFLDLRSTGIRKEQRYVRTILPVSGFLKNADKE